LPKPRIDNLSIGTGPHAGGTAVTVNGHRLDTPGLVVMFGGVPGLNLRSQSIGSCTVDSPAHAIGTVDVTVQGVNGRRANGGALPGGFVYT